jgi:hypothetical protein
MELHSCKQPPDRAVSAMKSFRDGLAIADRLAKSDPAMRNGSAIFR